MVLKFIIALLVLGVSALCNGCGEDLESSRIINGNRTEPNSIPWQVSLPQPGCGGTIICEKFVMTAAHCVEDIDPVTKEHIYYEPNEVTVFAEEHNWEDQNDHVEHSVKNIHRHQQYKFACIGNSCQLSYDFAILELNKPIDLGASSKARAACLPDASDSSRIFKQGTEFVASGWGRHIGGNDHTYPDKLRHATISWQPNKTCGGNSQKASFCAGKQDGTQGTCHGDSGGPLTWKDDKTQKVKLVGVTSFGEDSCFSISGFADVTKVLGWVKEIIGECNGNTGGNNGGGNTTP